MSENTGEIVSARPGPAAELNAAAGHYFRSAEFANANVYAGLGKVHRGNGASRKREIRFKNSYTKRVGFEIKR